jgi:predicted permease
MIDQLGFAFGITGPVLLLLALGALVRRAGLIDQEFIRQANALVYTVALPVMLYFAIATRPITDAFDPLMSAIGVGGTLIIIAMALLVGRLLPEDQRGVFVQGSYRGNLAILGIALALATYGTDSLPMIAVYIAIVTTVYNLVAIWLLDSSGALGQIIRNPILIGIAAGSIGSLLSLPAPTILVGTADYLTALVLPVALICIGASLELKSLSEHRLSLALASIFKLIISPILLVGLGLAAGLRDERIGILFCLAASPTATASYVIASRLTRHGKLAAEIIAVTALFGVFTYTAGLALLRAYGFT